MDKHKIWSSLALALTLALVLFGSPRIAQAQEATVVGRIQDPSGAVMPGVQVEMKFLSTNDVFRAVTTATGDYTLSNLRVGAYEIQASAAGFRTEVRTGITLEIGRAYRFDFALTVSQVAERVEVTSEAPLLNTEKPEVATVIDNTKIQELPLNGRDVVGALTSLVPGVAPVRGCKIGICPQLPGSYNLNGMRQQDTLVLVDGSMLSQNNGAMTYIQAPDSTQEFEVKTSLYGAEYGNRPGGVISVVTKSGTNTLHGTLFEFLRNNKLDARNFFDRERRPPFKQNQYGATVGGPVYLPGVFNGKDKAWFFFSWQGQRQRKFQSFTGIVPTADEKAGRFSSPIIDPLSRQPFANNTIPANRINDVSRRFLVFWPDPNTPGALNFTCPACAVKDDRAQVIAKTDFKTSNANRFSGRFIWDSFPIRQLNPIQIFTRVDPLSTWAGNFVNTHTFSPTVVNEFGVHYFKRPYSPGRGTQSASPKDFNRSLGLPNFPRSAADLNKGVLGLSVPGYLALGDAFWYGQAPIGNFPEIKENLSFYKGSHSLKTGYQLRRNFSYNQFSSSSSVNFSDRYTGNAFADFLLGFPTSTTLGADLYWGDLTQMTHSFYLQDDWKATSKLTVNLGVRYEYRGPWEDRSGLSSNFNLRTGQIDPPYVERADLPAGQTGRYQANVPLVTFSKRGILPRIGLAYRLTPKTVVRSGYGAYGNEPYFAGYWNLGGNPRQNAVIANFFGDLATPTLSLSNPFPVTAAATPLFSPIGIQSPFPMMVVHQWGLSVQRELSRNTSFEVAYQGHHSLHEFTSNDVNAATPGPGALQARRRFPAFASIQMWLGNGDSNYNALEVKLQRRPGPDGLSLLLAYTFSKVIDISSSGGETISPNVSRSLNRGMGEGSVPGRLVLTPGYRSPFGPGRKFLTDNPLGHVLGGWTVWGVLTLAAGDYLTASMPSDSLNVGSTASFRPNVLRDPNMPASERTPQRWFDTSAFVTPPPFTYGNAGRGIVKGPNVRNLDLGLLRDFKLYERMTLQFRFEAFNLTNHTNFVGPGTTFATGGFGVIGRAYESRDLQFGLKLLF